MRTKGFTITELIIAMSIMAIILALAFVNLNSSQLKSRDQERKADVESIVLHLEAYYKNGTGDPDELLGRYPSTSIGGGTVQSVRNYLRDIDDTVLYSPNKYSESGSGVSFMVAADSGSLGPTVDQYIYQPLSWNGADWTLCTGSSECRRFNIYYRAEADDLVKVISSRNQ